MEDKRFTEYWTEEYRRRREQTKKNKGIKDDRELWKSFPSVQKRLSLTGGMEGNKECSKYLGIVIEETFVLKLFGNIEPTLLRKIPGNHDWKDENGVKYKHIASRPIERTWANGGNDYFKWLIDYNRDPDHFILSGWNENFEPLYLWDIKKDEIIRERKFYQRVSFSIVNTTKKLKEFEKYEMKDKLEELKGIVKEHRDALEELKKLKNMLEDKTDIFNFSEKKEIKKLIDRLEQYIYKMER